MSDQEEKVKVNIELSMALRFGKVVEMTRARFDEISDAINEKDFDPEKLTDEFRIHPFKDEIGSDDSELELFEEVDEEDEE